MANSTCQKLSSVQRFVRANAQYLQICMSRWQPIFLLIGPWKNGSDKGPKNLTKANGANCYSHTALSNYLCQRDFKEFEHLFVAFGVRQNIRYCNFDDICEQFINSFVDVRKSTESWVKGQGSTSDANRLVKIGRPRYLLIDEIDVFVSEDFYGSSYDPVSLMEHPTISALMEYVWQHRGSKRHLKFSEIKKTNQFKECAAALNGCLKLVIHMVKRMCADVQTFQSHDYVISGNRIGYKSHGELTFSTISGFKTAFAYFQLREDKLLTQSALQEQMYFPIHCGSFSYAEIPRMYARVLGVTGTLDTLSAPENEILTNVYLVRKQSFIPSVYGESKLDPVQKIKIVSDDEFHIALINEINERLIMNGRQVKRAVLVFFESLSELERFQDFEPYQKSEFDKAVITEKTDGNDRAGLISMAATSGHVTLLTRAFGRGVDFICYDDVLLANGGVHVIQTFVSDVVSEQVQIKGRTARQGNQGSYSMMLRARALAKYGITVEAARVMQTKDIADQEISKQRDEYFARQFPDSMKYVDGIRQAHDDSKQFLEYLRDNREPDFLNAFLVSYNHCGSDAEADIAVCRTVVLVDGTSSMSGFIAKSRRAIKDIFDRSQQILAENKADNFELQFAIYRNYNAPPQNLLECSAWTTSHSELGAFMDRVSAGWGFGGEEAIEIGLWHVNQACQRGLSISQVIVIGSAEPNSKENIAARRAQGRWEQTPFHTPTNFEAELAQITAAKIPVHTFFIHQGAEKAFREIAAATGGNCGFLDIDSPNGAEMLTGILAKEILRKSGGAGLVQAYEEKFAK
eukprot:c9453_g1_i2.p1 GENE.c9453_g1_i2~~c9453_g1_i2.p1  ORF type:complete len:802 (-),score=140.84 c9453_g1_i2:47-2452(-)